MNLRKDILPRKDEILKFIEDGKPKVFICKELKCQESTLEFWLEKMNIKYKGKQNWSKGFIKVPIEFYLKKDSYVHNEDLKKKLFESGLKEKKCENKICQRTKWNGKEIPLQLHHKDGDKYNNELSNLEILCANCHAQTDNYCRSKSSKKKIKEQKTKKEIQKNLCSCGKEISIGSKKCKSCVKLSQKRKINNRPSLKILLNELKNNSYLEIGRKYKVSDNCIRKWIKNYGENPPKK